MVQSIRFFFACVAGLSAVSAALGATSWLGPLYTLNLPDVHQTAQIVSSELDLSIQHDTTADVTVHPQRAGGETLTEPGGTTLTTFYMLTGPCLQNPDADWVSASDFLLRSYHIQTGGPAIDVLHLSVKGQAPPNRALPAANYTTDFVLTVTY